MRLLVSTHFSVARRQLLNLFSLDLLALLFGATLYSGILRSPITTLSTELNPVAFNFIVGTLIG
jgi:hypothetical protein